jgi:hypothetical protein
MLLAFVILFTVPCVALFSGNNSHQLFDRRAMEVLKRHSIFPRYGNVLFEALSSTTAIFFAQ